MRRCLFPALFCVLLVLPACESMRSHARRSHAAEARAAWQRLERSSSDAAALEQYRHSVSEVLGQLAAREASPSNWPETVAMPDGWIVHVDQGRNGLGAWSPKLLDQLMPAKASPKRDLPNGIRAGLGVPMVGVRDRDDADRDHEFVFSRGQRFPVTAVLEFRSDARTEATLHFYDPRETKQTKIGAQRLDVAADFISPVQAVLNGRSFLTQAFGGLLRPGRFLERMSLYQQEPYRADKIPVIFVHGLMSDPHIWENEVIAIESDPELGPRVQCWCFEYPTGLPLAASSQRLRATLRRAAKTLDPEGDDFGINRMMLVGHSMGGLVARMQIVESGDAFWKTWFTKPPGELTLNGDEWNDLRESLLFAANPDVRRAVFVATPHHGAEDADGRLARLVVRLIQTPRDILRVITSVATLDPELINPNREAFQRMGANGVGTLSPKHPLLKALNSCPMSVPVDSIIAVKDPSAPRDIATDGYVAYRSAHLDQARTETIVKSNHFCVEKPETVAAVVRLVRDYVQSR